MGKKKFIEKKKSATFQLLSRDTSDPAYSADSDRVFIRVDNNPYNFTEDDPDSIFADADDDVGDEDVVILSTNNSSNSRNGLPDEVRKEILELGFPDDGYNYLNHLREIRNTGGGSAFYENPKAKIDHIPLDVKAYDASRVRVPKVLVEDDSEEALYKVAAKTVGLRIQKVDPEVDALLRDDLSRFGSDDEELEEDFVVEASQCEDTPNDVEEIEFHEVKQVIAEENINQFDDAILSENESKSVGDSAEKNELFQGDEDLEEMRVRRPLDEEFDALELQAYGSESDNEYDGFIPEDEEMLVNKLGHALNDRPMDDLELDDKYRAPADLLRDTSNPKNIETMESATKVIQRCAEYAEKYENEDDKETEVMFEESSDESEAWDCETILSTYSTLDNHPGKIQAPETSRKKKLSQTVSDALSHPKNMISLRGKQKLPVDFLPNSGKSTTEKVKGSSDDLKNDDLLKRKQHGQETKEEKKERKAAVKEERCEARRIKKEFKGLYKGEAQRAQRVAAVSGPSSIHLM